MVRKTLSIAIDSDFLEELKRNYHKEMVNNKRRISFSKWCENLLRKGLDTSKLGL